MSNISCADAPALALKAAEAFLRRFQSLVKREIARGIPLQEDVEGRMRGVLWSVRA